MSTKCSPDSFSNVILAGCHILNSCQKVRIFLARNSQIQDFFLISNFSKASLTLSETDRTDSETDPKHSEGSLKHSHILASLITLFQNQLFHTFQPFISERTIIYKYRNIITYFYDLIVIMTAPGNWYWNWPKNCNFFNFLSRDFFLSLNSRDLDKLQYCRVSRLVAVWIFIILQIYHMCTKVLAFSVDFQDIFSRQN